MRVWILCLVVAGLAGCSTNEAPATPSPDAIGPLQTGNQTMEASEPANLTVSDARLVDNRTSLAFSYEGDLRASLVYTLAIRLETSLTVTPSCIAAGNVCYVPNLLATVPLDDAEGCSAPASVIRGRDILDASITLPAGEHVLIVVTNAEDGGLQLDFGLGGALLTVPRMAPNFTGDVLFDLWSSSRATGSVQANGTGNWFAVGALEISGGGIGVQLPRVDAGYEGSVAVTGCATTSAMGVPGAQEETSWISWSRGNGTADVEVVHESPAIINGSGTGLALVVSWP